jgi:hypothetical protein
MKDYGSWAARLVWATLASAVAILVFLTLHAPARAL